VQERQVVHSPVHKHGGTQLGSACDEQMNTDDPQAFVKSVKKNDSDQYRDEDDPGRTKQKNFLQSVDHTGATFINPA
jgi:hypothetical protein